MKAFKTADCIIQGAIFIFGIGLFSLTNFKEESFMMYFLLGGWQMLSVFVHLFNRSYIKSGIRKVYLILLLITFVAGLVCMVDDDIFLYYLMALLVWSPVLALLYLTGCIIETRKLTMTAPLQEDAGTLIKSRQEG